MKTPLPHTISAAVLREHADPSETHFIRLTYLGATGGTRYTLRGTGRRKGTYILEKDGVSGKYSIDIPVSIWNHGIPEGRYSENPSIAHDILSKPQALIPLIVTVVTRGGPGSNAESAETSADSITLVQEFLAAVDAPQFVQDAIKVLKDEGPERFKEIGPEAPKTETPAAKRMREKRAREKAEKLAEPQPA